MSDTKEIVQENLEELNLAPGEIKTLRHEFKKPKPGFYLYYVDLLDQNLIRNKVVRQIGYNPEEISDTIDACSDFDAFWDEAKAELASVQPEYNVTFNKNLGNHIIYNVEMKSIKGKIIKGYFSVPNKPGKFPTKIQSNGFNLFASIPTNNDDYAVFNYNIRGQGLSTDYTKTEYLFVNGLQDKNTYYYREGIMDAIRAIDFVCSRNEVDKNKIVAEGGSQGGGLTFAMAALDKRIVAVAPTLPFMSDYRHYYDIKENNFDIDEWPMDYLNDFMVKYSISKEAIFKNLSYFDIKNFAGKINCPLLMGVGLQDPICPPHINFAGYNQVRSQKEYMISKNTEHTLDKNFGPYKEDWFKKILANINADTTIKYKDFNDQIKSYTNGRTITVYSTLERPLTLSIFRTDGVLIKKVNFGNSTSQTVTSGIYILSISDEINSSLRKMVVQ
jgi:cephalosporin-C deacetylase-like acetyl esterase